jgi:recombination protein RecR
MYPAPIRNVVSAFKRLPSVGERTAERFVFSLLKSGKKDVAGLIIALKGLMETIVSCEVCWDFSDQSPCALCADTTRDGKTICVVAQPQDLHAIEKTGVYRGTYHVLRGVLVPENPDSLRETMRRLLSRLENDAVSEVVLALNPDMPGETTARFIERELERRLSALKVSRLARGLPMGSDIQYADELTLSSAFKHRVS